MNEWFPVHGGSPTTYTDNAVLVSSGCFLGIGIVLLLISSLLKKCLKSDLHEPVPNLLYQLDGTQDALIKQKNAAFNQPIRLYNEAHSLEILRKEFEEPGVTSFVVGLVNWLGWFLISMVPICFSFFGVLLNPIVSAIIMFLILFGRARRGYYSRSRQLYEGMRLTNPNAYAKEIVSTTSTYKKSVFFLLFLSVLTSFSFTDGCISYYEEFSGFHINFINLSISSKLSRYFQLRDSCPPGPPCHIYATLPEDASTGVFINLHTHDQYENIILFYDEKDFYQNNNYLRYSGVASTIKLDYLEQRGRRSVHSALLNGLTPETRYIFQVQYDGVVQTTFDYVTLPDENSTKNIVLSTGGDLGDNSLGQNITSQVGAVNPDVIIVGGDLAYDDGEHNCYFTWDHFLTSFALSTLKAGRLIPFLFSVGNHDVGLDPLSGRTLDISEKGPLYMVFFPQHTVETRDSKGTSVSRVPDIKERKSYHYHKFGRILHFNLDNGYLSSFEEQTGFISGVSQANPDYIKMVSQHNPTYWACSEDEHNLAVIKTKKYWVPLYDEFKFMSIFENHEHCFKKSFPLTGNAYNENGAYYLGNGNWGTKPAECKINNGTGVLEVVKQTNHFWLVNVSLSEGVVKYTPIDKFGNPVVPTFEQEIDNYVSL